jgi:hypothetical protein
MVWRDRPWRRRTDSDSPVATIAVTGKGKGDRRRARLMCQALSMSEARGTTEFKILFTVSKS